MVQLSETLKHNQVYMCACVCTHTHIQTLVVPFILYLMIIEFFPNSRHYTSVCKTLLDLLSVSAFPFTKKVTCSLYRYQ